MNLWDVVIFLSKTGYFTQKELVINYNPNYQRWLSLVHLSKPNLSAFVHVWTCDPTDVAQALYHCATQVSLMMLVYFCRRAGGGGAALSHDQGWSGGLRQPLWHPLGQGHGFRQLQRAFGLYVGHHGRRRLEGKGLLLIGHFYRWIQNTTDSNKSCETPENLLFTTVLFGTVLMKCI